MSVSLPFSLLLEGRVGYASVTSCPLNYKEGETGEIYGKLVRTWTMDNGTYDEIWEYSANEFVGDNPSCPTVSYSDTAVPGFDYGGVISSSDAYTLPLATSDVTTELDGTATDWGEWSTLLTWGASGGQGVHALLDSVHEESAASQITSEATSNFDGTGYISASRTDIEFRFTLQIPLACTVVYKIGELEVGVDLDYVWGAEQTQIVGETPVTLNIPATEGFYKRLQIVKIIAHPWT